MSNSDRRRRARKQTADPLRDSLDRTRAETAALVLGLQAHSQQTESLLNEIARHERDLRRLLDGIKDILDTVDRLVAYEGDDIEAYRASVRKTANLLASVLNGHSDMELIGRPGEIADPSTHQVIKIEDANLPQDTVVKVLERGVRYRGELVRAASVVVSSGKEQHA